ncbi:uncharacterized protein LOC143274591 isoform X2 [Babylonia areolata]|uniref:uncharacterized protein LOC143274591 isoform X2 n=1 Tax=Babylonia areolata TaxID=304850 RepID=UPI003FD110C7
MDDGDQQSYKIRHAECPSGAKRVEDQHTSQGALNTAHTLPVSAIAAAPEVKLVKGDIFTNLRHYYSTVCTSEKRGPSQAAGPITAAVKMQRGSTVYPSGLGGQVVMVKAEKNEAFSPAASGGESVPTPSHTTKSSSLSRDISPSRITAQMVSAMSSESSQPLLLSALTGTMPTHVMLSSLSRPDPTPDRKHKQLEVPTHGRASPYMLPEQQRHSPLQAEGRGSADSKVLKGHSLASAAKPFESLMRAAELVQAQEFHQGRSSPGKQGSSSVPNEGRRGTPSPKPASLSVARSPKRHTGLQGQRRSPMAVVGSRPSPVPSPGQEGVSVLSSTATLSGGVMIPLQQMGLVQQHLLAATLTSTTTTTTTTTPTTTTTTTTFNSHSRPGSMVPTSQSSPHNRSGSGTPQTHVAHSGRVAAAPSVPSIQLTTIAVNMSGAASPLTIRGAKNSHVMSVGTGTELRRYTSHGAQTKGKGEEGAKVEDSQPHRREEGVKVVDGAVGRVVVSPVSGQVGSTRSQMVSDPVALMEARALGRTCSTLSSSSFSPLSTAALSQAGPRHKWPVSLPTPAHSSKPISVPSSHPHPHTHLHQPASSSSLPHASSSAPSALTRPPVSSSAVSCVSSGSQQSLSGVPLSTTQVQPTAVSVSAGGSSACPSASVVMCAQYQPHHHRSQHSPPAQTVTSQTSKAGPVIKDFIPVLGPPDPPPPYHHHHPPPSRPPSSHVNPFTFPTSGVKVHDAQDKGRAYSLIGQDADQPGKGGAGSTELHRPHPHFPSSSHKSVSDVSHLRKVSDLSQLDRRSEEMPRLTPEGAVSVKSEAALLTNMEGFNHVDAATPGDIKEQLMSPFNQRLRNLNNFPSMTTAYRSAYRSQSVAMQRAKAGVIMSPAKSLDLVRQNIQKKINEEVDQIVRKYMDKFVKPAAENIRLNNGADAVSEEHMNTVCRQILEEAKRMYSLEGRRSLTPVTDFPDNVSDSGSVNGKRVSPTPTSKRLRASDSDSERGSDGGLPKKIPRRKGRPPLNSSGRSTPLKPVVKQDSVREGPKWDPDRIKPDTLFVMGARANKALGLGNTRGRLYIRHPDVFKYSGDQEDKVWLHEQKLLPATGGKAYLLIVEDIVDLSKTEEYRDSPTLLMHECRGFEVPNWMRGKIQDSMRAMRADSLKRSRSRSPLPVTERAEPPKSLPFASFSDTASNNDADSNGNKNSLQPSPADTEEMESMENEDTQPSDASPFKMSGGLEDNSSQSSCPTQPGDQEAALASTS